MNFISFEDWERILEEIKSLFFKFCIFGPLLILLFLARGFFLYISYVLKSGLAFLMICVD